jgi:hypothetical protein
MTGYFSRLMEQTGISAGHGVRSAPKTLVEPWATETNIVAPIDLEHTRLVEPQQNDAAAPNSPELASELSISSIENPAELQPGNKVPKVTDYLPEPEKPREQSEPLEEREFIVRDVDATSPRGTMAARESLEVQVMTETDASRDPPSVTVQQGAPGADETIESVVSREDERPASSDPTPKQNERPASGHRTPKQALTRQPTPTRRPDQKSRDRMDQTEAWQGAVKEIQEWVAETPVVNDAEAQNRVRSETEVTRPNFPLVERERFAASNPNRVAPSPHEEPETQDLHLAIGTISVTVEEPRREIEVRSSDDQVQESPNVANDERSRLSRHYIRTW